MIKLMTKHKHQYGILFGLLLLALCSLNVTIIEHAIDTDHSSACELCSLGQSLAIAPDANHQDNISYSQDLQTFSISYYFLESFCQPTSRAPPRLLA